MTFGIPVNVAIGTATIIDNVSASAIQAVDPALLQGTIKALDRIYDALTFIGSVLFALTLFYALWRPR